jgi:hypothetical protein
MGISPAGNVALTSCDLLPDLMTDCAMQKPRATTRLSKRPQPRARLQDRLHEQIPIARPFGFNDWTGKLWTQTLVREG